MEYWDETQTMNFLSREEKFLFNLLEETSSRVAIILESSLRFPLVLLQFRIK